MRPFLCLMIVTAAAGGVIAFAQEEPQPPKAEVVTAAYAVKGLHCGACATTLEASLKKAKGVKSIKVDLKTETARITFDERAISAQEIARSLSDTPHMMGRDMRYAAALVLSVAGLKDNATGEKVKAALSNVEGVSKVTLSPRQQSVLVEFAGKGKAASRSLIEALQQAGLKGGQYGAGAPGKTSTALPPGEFGEFEDTAMARNGMEDHAGMRMGPGATTRMRTGGMPGYPGRGQRMGCGMAVPGMEDRDGIDEPAPQPFPGYYTPPAPGYYRNRAFSSGGCGCYR